MALKGTIEGDTANERIDCKIEWTATQSIDENYSYVIAKLYYSRNNKGYTTEGRWEGSMTINGRKVEAGEDMVITYKSNSYAMTAKVKVPHNPDGTKSCVISAKGAIDGTTLTATYIQGTIVLDTIPRPATITNAPDFDDESNPTITYSNKAENAITLLQACISFNGANDDIEYRDLNKTGNTYTFTLTEAEREILRAATTGASRSVRFYVRSIINDVTYLSYLTKTFSIVNANPIITPTIKDVDATTLALTGNADRIVKYFSDAQFTIEAEPQKGATLKSQKVSCAGDSSTAATGTLKDVESGSFVFSATDSRGFTTTQTVKKVIVDYVKLTCNVVASTPTAVGAMELTIKGNYFNNNFGVKDNTITVKYRGKIEDGAYSDWQEVTATVSGNTYSVTIPISGLDYQTKYTYQAQAADLLMTVTSAEKSVKSTPVFDWSKDDFNVNGLFNIKGKTVLRSNGDNNNIILSAEDATDGVFIRPNGTGNSTGQTIFYANGDVSINGKQLGKNKILWSGGNYMTGAQSITLEEEVSAQMNGIVLIFSRYSGGAAEDANFNCFFVPKFLVDEHSGTGSAFTMNTVNFSLTCCKYLYISNTSITGNDLNTATGTGDNGVKYANNTYVLRYVIGV